MLVSLVVRRSSKLKSDLVSWPRKTGPRTNSKEIKKKVEVEQNIPLVGCRNCKRCYKMISSDPSVTTYFPEFSDRDTLGFFRRAGLLPDWQGFRFDLGMVTRHWI